MNNKIDVSMLNALAEMYEVTVAFGKTNEFGQDEPVDEIGVEGALRAAALVGATRANDLMKMLINEASDQIKSEKDASPEALQVAERLLAIAPLIENTVNNCMRASALAHDRRMQMPAWAPLQ